MYNIVGKVSRAIRYYEGSMPKNWWDPMVKRLNAEKQLEIGFK